MPSKNKQIKSNSELIINRDYHCFNKKNGTHSIKKCNGFNDENKKVGFYPATDDDNQALEKWDLFLVDIPKTNRNDLCVKHHGNSETSHCLICIRNKL